MASAGMSLIADGKLCDSTVSPVDARADRAYHLLAVEGYWRSKAIPNGELISSRPFLVGGHRWHIDYHPNGVEEESEEFISVFLVLDDDDVEEGQDVKAHVVFSFIDQPELRTPTRVSHNQMPPRYYRRGYGHQQFIRRNILERSVHLKEDGFIIRCDVVVAKNDDTDAKAACSSASSVDMPPSDMASHLGDPLLSKVGADVTFEVGGETFAAHRYVLAARSTVFKELLFGGTGTTTTKINDIEPKIFQNLLVYIYTDSFPDWEWNEDDEEVKSEEGEEEEDDGEETESGEEEDEEETESGEEEDEEETESGEEEDEDGEETESGEEEDEEETESVEDENEDEYITWLLQLTEAADRYDLQRLKSICAEELVGCICRRRVADIVVVAEQRQCHLLKDSCVDFIKTLSSLYTVLTADSIDEIMRTCSPSVLKELIFKFAP